MNILLQSRQVIEQLLAELFQVEATSFAHIAVTINTDKDRSFGDISTNAAMVVAKNLKKNPREVAEKLQQALLQSSFGEFLENVNVAGPGFLNILFTAHAWHNQLLLMHKQQADYFKQIGKPKLRYLLEYVSANPTGPLHLGGGRGGIIGDVIANVLKFQGHEVSREYYINDAGNQVKLLGASFKARCLQQLGVNAEFPEGGYAGEYLIAVAQECVAEHGVSLTEQSDDFFITYAKDKLIAVVKKDLIDYGVSYDSWFSEKSLHTDGSVAQALLELEKKDLAYEKDGALWFKAEQFGDAKDRVLRKSSGEMTYIAADVAYHKNKFDRGYDRLIDILGQDHHGYVTRLKATMQALGYPAENLDVIVYQLVTIKENEVAVRMSKRAGNFTQLSDVVDTVGKDCARFFYLNRKADAHLEFDLGVALKKTEENPVFYIQYAYVRTGSVLAKAEQEELLKQYVAQFVPGQDLEKVLFADYSMTEQDYALMRKIVSFTEILAAITHSYQTHVLAYYALELAQVFHNYYAHNRVIELNDIAASRFRLFMIVRVRMLLALSLDLLGLDKPERM